MNGWLFDSHDFMARSQCGPGWSDGLVYLSQAANAAIAGAYFYIPIMLTLLYVRVRKDPILHRVIEGRAWILLMFAAFIFSCGLTHLANVVAFHWPAYRFFTAVDLLTAALSLPTAHVLVRIVVDIILVRRRYSDGSPDLRGR